MKKRKSSDEIIQRNSSIKTIKNSRNPRNFDSSGSFTNIILNKGRKADRKWNLSARVKRFFESGHVNIEFPEHLDIFSSDTRWTKIFHNLAFPEKSSIFLDLKKTKFIYPEFLVYLAATSEHLLTKSNVRIQTQKETSTSLDPIFNAYLRTSGIRDFFGIGSDLDNREVKLFGDCVAISRDNEDRSSISYKFAELMNPYLGHIPGYSTHDLGEALGEIMGNSIEHGEVPAWFKIGQVHNDRRAITLAIADNGLGIPYTLRNGYDKKRFLKLSDSEILRESLKPDVTRMEPKFGEAHGAGLATVNNSISNIKGNIAILSGNGLYRKNFSTGHEELTDLKHQLPGTLLVLRINF